MEYDNISPDGERILKLIIAASNPSKVLQNLFNTSDSKSVDRLRSIVGELDAQNYINVFWGDGIPYHVTLNNKALEYESKASNKHQKNTSSYISIDKSINIGNGNNFTNSTIGNKNLEQVSPHDIPKKERFWNRHSFIASVISAIIASFIMLFSFWDKIINWIEGVL